MVSGLISAFLIIGALILFYNSAMSIYNGDPGPEQLLTLAAALIAAVANEVKYRYAHCVGKQVNSPAVLSHAEHARIDAVTSALAGVGVVCARLGLHFVDPLLAMFDVVIQLKTSYKMLQNSVRSLMDLTLPEDKVRHIRDVVGAVEGVNEIDYLYARQLGQHVWIELSIFLHPDITVYDGKVIAENVKNNIMGNVEKIGNVQIQFLTRAA
jgi:cation diffusion facilitator family transporter